MPGWPAHRTQFGSVPAVRVGAVKQDEVVVVLLLIVEELSLEVADVVMVEKEDEDVTEALSLELELASEDVAELDHEEVIVL